METVLVNETAEDVWFDDFSISRTPSIVIQENHYDPWGLKLTGLGYQYGGVNENIHLFNNGSLYLEDLNLYWTPNRFYDPTIGRFQGIDKLSDLYTSFSPMSFGFNNPILFSDPTGLNGDCGKCKHLPEFTVTASRLPSWKVQYESLLYSLSRSKSPIERNLGNKLKNYGLNYANDMMNRGVMLHYDSQIAALYKESEFMSGIRKMYSYGVTGSIVAIAGSPILIEGMFHTMTNKTGLNMTFEAGWQAGNSLLYNGDFSQVDLADIGLSVFSKYGFVGMALIDYNSSGEFSMVGNGKSTLQFGTDILIGSYNKWHVDAMGVGGVEKSVINFFNRFNSNLRNTVGTGIKEGVKDE